MESTGRAWVRPGELLVSAEAEPHVGDRLRERGCAPYAPGHPGVDWRQQSGAPENGDLNGRLTAGGAGWRLWRAPGPGDVADLVGEARGGGVRPNHVFIGEDFYHGGPGRAPTPADKPVIRAAPTTDDPEVAVLDNGLPEGWREDFPGVLPGGRHKFDLVEDPLDRDTDGLLDEQAGHGLFIGGLIARVAPELVVWLGRVLRSTGEGDEAMLMTALSGLPPSARVVNLSLGGHTVDDAEPAVAAVLRSLAAAGKVVVAAAGNGGLHPESARRPFWPAAMPEVVAVGAYDSTAAEPGPWPAGNPGADVLAPGHDLWSYFVQGVGRGHGSAGPVRFHEGATWSGTSFATPLVAARLAQLIRQAPDADPRALVDGWLAGLPAPAWDSGARLYEVAGLTR